MNRSYVIEKRQPDGSLDFSHPQPEDVFGLPAIVGTVLHGGPQAAA